MTGPEIPKGVEKHVKDAMFRLQKSGLPYKPGDFIGQKYQVYGLLGAGGFGIVYLVVDTNNKSALALKTFHEKFLQGAEARDLFRKEAETWVRLERHPYLVRVYFVDEVSSRLYMGVEYIAPGEQGLNSLQGYLERQPPDLPQSLRWAIQFCHGMEYAYSKGITYHGDIKPDNIMISDNTVKISDFGLARVIGEEEKGEWFVKGYTAPEGAVDERSDIYSFGVVLRQMATGSTKPPLPERIPSVNGPMQAVIKSCLQNNPKNRYPTFKELRGELEHLLKKETGEVIEPPEFTELEGMGIEQQGKGPRPPGAF